MIHIFNLITARVRSTREGNVLTRVCPSINLSVHRGGGVPISHNALQHFPECHEAVGGYPDPPGGVPGSGTPPGGYPGQVPPRVPGPPRGVPRSGTFPPGGTQVRYHPPGGGTRVRYPPGGVPGPPRGGTRVRYPPGGYPSQVPPPGGYPDPPPGGYLGQVSPRGVPKSGTPPQGGTRVGQQKEYSLHGGRYASCVHAGGLSCILNSFSSHEWILSDVFVAHFSRSSYFIPIS